MVKRIIIYSALTVFLFIFNIVYTSFGHGVSSRAMASSWLYLLCLGAVYIMINLKVSSRLGANIYNSGAAVLIVGRLVQGVLDIAGKDSGYVGIYNIAGYIFTCSGLLIYVRAFVKIKKGVNI